jgi:signal transduction histidine kinase
MPTTKSSILAAIALVVLTVCNICVYAQTDPGKRRLDSLDALIRECEGRTDTASVRILADVADEFTEYDSKYALSLARRAESLVVNGAITPLRIHVLNILASVYRNDNDYSESAKCYERALAMAKNIEENHEVVSALLGLGLVLSEQGKFDKELQKYLEAMPYVEVLGDQRLKTLVLMRLAGLYHSTKNYARSDSLYTEAQRQCTRKDDNDLLATLYNNRGVLYEEMRQSERALEAYRHGLEIDLRLGRKQRIGRFYNNIGEVFMGRNQFDSALVYQRRALDLYEQIGYNSGLANLLGTIALTQNKQRMFSEAVISARRALSFAEPSDFKKEKLVAYQALSDAFAGLGDYRSSLAMFKQVAALQDSMYSIASAQKLAELETAQKEQEIRLLISQKAQENIIRNALIAGALVLAGVAVVFIRGNNRRKRDNTRLAELNDKLFDANEELSLLTSEKDEILNIVTHGLKSNIFGVRSIADSMTTALADDAVPKNAVPLAEMSRTISRSATQMFSLVTNLLTVNTAEQGLLKPTLVQTDVAAALREVCEQFRDFAAVKNITLREMSPSAETGTQFTALADEQMLREILENLLSNAVKYSPQGKSIDAVLRVQGNAVRIEIRDEGEGISPSDMPKLFGKFARLSAQPTGGEHSTGLGLSIVKKMVEAMNGRVWCESEFGRGATFIVELPKA